jgi:hypothetical protein
MSYDSGDPTDLALCYHNIYQYAILQMTPGFFADDFENDYGHWRLFSLGPTEPTILSALQTTAGFMIPPMVRSVEVS